MRRLVASIALVLVWFSAPAHAVTTTLVASGVCASATASCTIPISTAVPGGSFLVVVAATQTTVPPTTISDNATTSNCSGAYSIATRASSANGSIVVGVCAATSGAMSGGATCGTGGTTQCAITATWGTAYYGAVQAYMVSGVASFDKAGSAVTGTWASGTATSFASTPSLGYPYEWALSIVVADGGTTADSLASFNGGFASVGWLSSALNTRPQLFLAGQTLMSGPATFAATPTSSAARNFNSIVLLFPITGAVLCGNSGAMLMIGMGGGGGSCASTGTALDFSDPSNSALASAI